MGFLPPGEDDDDEDHLSQLKKLKDKFQDKNGQPIKLTLEQFVKALSSDQPRHADGADAAAQRNRVHELGILFKKIDASCTDTVDWEEFTNYYLLHMPGAGSQDGGGELAVAPQGSDMLTGAWGSCHNDMISRVIVVKDIGAGASNNQSASGGGRRYITAGRDGMVKVWHPNLTVHKAIDVEQGRSWLASCCWMTKSRRLAVASANFKIFFYDSTFGAAPIAHIDHKEGTPLCMGYLDRGTYESDGRDRDILMVGDNNGCVTIYHFDDNWTEQASNNEELQFKEKRDKRPDQVGASADRDRDRVNYVGIKSRTKYHTDWVTKVDYVPELQAMVTCGLDGDINMCDVNINNRKSGREGDDKPGPPVRLHKKGLYCFCWCKKHKFFASAGLDRQIVIWNGFTQKSMNHLIGHNAPVTEILCNEAQSQLISMSIDKVVKVWDIRNYRCIQTFTDKTEYRPEDSLTCMAFDEEASSLLMCSSALNVLPLHMKAETSRTHVAPIVGVLYNDVFQQVISGDSLGSVCVWDARTGKLQFDFKRAHRDSKLTCMAFDESKRRLYTGGEDGLVKLWNFSSGQLLQSYTMPQPSELTGLLWAREGPNTFVVGLAWDRRVYVWPDSRKQTVEPQYILEDSSGFGHTDDITCISRLSSNTGLLATCGDDGFVAYWKIQESSSGMCHRLIDKSTPSSQQGGSKSGTLDPKALKRKKTSFTRSRQAGDRDAGMSDSATPSAWAHAAAATGSALASATARSRASHAFGVTGDNALVGAPVVPGLDPLVGEDELADEQAPGVEKMIVLEHKGCLLSVHTDRAVRLWSIRLSDFLARLELLGPASQAAPERAAQPPASAREPAPQARRAEGAPDGSATARVTRQTADASASLARCQNAAVTSLFADTEQNKWLFTGDAEGWIRVFDLAPVVPGRAGQPKHLLQLHEFRAHRAAVGHMEHFELDGHSVVVSASTDFIVLHSAQGERIGSFGSHGPDWLLSDRPGWCAEPLADDGRGAEEDDGWAFSPRRVGVGRGAGLAGRTAGRGGGAAAGAPERTRMVAASQAHSGRGVFKALSSVERFKPDLTILEQERAKQKSWDEQIKARMSHAPGEATGMDERSDGGASDGRF